MDGPAFSRALIARSGYAVFRRTMAAVRRLSSFPRCRCCSCLLSRNPPRRLINGSSSQRVSGLTHVQSGMNAPMVVDMRQPIQDEEAPLDTVPLRRLARVNAAAPIRSSSVSAGGT